MTVLALKLSRAANGVSELHGRVSRQMWNTLWPDRPVEEVPIGHITNGIHLIGWMKGPVRKFWQRKLSGAGALHGLRRSETTSFWKQRRGISLEKEVNSTEFWQKMADPEFISDEELWALRYKLRRELIEFARRRLGQRVSQSDFIAFDQLLQPDALTIGFARRFATYKRAPLIFDQLENIVKLVQDRRRPVQFIFAGKAHPRDDDGKKLHPAHHSFEQVQRTQRHLVFIENYDVHVARQMVSGCDIWLNNPRRPLEASGTSGQKAGCHGCLNLSIMDGWWREGYDGTNGFAIGGDEHPASIEEQDQQDSANLYKALTEEVIPAFYNRDDRGMPRQWIASNPPRHGHAGARNSTPGAWCRNTPKNIICRKRMTCRVWITKPSSGWKPTSSSKPNRKCGAAAPMNSARRPTPMSARFAWACPASCRWPTRKPCA